MPGKPAPPLPVVDSDRLALEKLLRRHSTPQNIALRAKIILRAADGKGHSQVARELGISRDMSQLWRKRWQQLEDSGLPVEERLQDAARPGSPPKFTLEQLTHLYALACDPPEKYGYPISHWSPQELTAELIKQNIVDSISPRHVGRLLQEVDLKPHQNGYWLHPPPTQSSRTKLKTSVNSTPVPNNELRQGK